MKEIIIKKGEIIQQSGEFNTKVYHVKKGLLRSYSIDNSGKESIYMFAPKGWVIADNCPPDSKSDMFIDALEDSVVVVLDKDLEKEKENVGAFAKRLHVMQKTYFDAFKYKCHRTLRVLRSNLSRYCTAHSATYDCIVYWC